MLIFSVILLIVVVGLGIKLIDGLGQNSGRGLGNIFFSPQLLYRKRESVMNQSEAVLFSELQKQLPQGYHVFPKMRIADMLETIEGRGYYWRRNQILPKHVDFLVCDSNFRPIVAIELNGKSHQRLDRIERDELVNKIFSCTTLPLQTINVGQDFALEVEKIFRTFKPAMQAQS